MTDLAALHRAFDVPPDAPVRRLVRRAQEAAGLGPLVISMAVAEGHRLGTGSAHQLATHRRRAAVYAALAERLAEAADVTVLKGAAIARHYPVGLVRPAGDLDLVVASEPELWRAARVIADAWHPDAIALTAVDTDDACHLVIGFDRPAEDPLLEPDYAVELATFAFPGDQAAVPLRAAPPADGAVAQLVALAEERCQRPFSVKDALDCVYLLDAEPDALRTDGARQAIDEACRAPELAELLEFAAAVFPKRLDPRAAEGLAPLAAAEHDRRRERGAGGGAAGVGRWSAAPRSSFGLFLGGDGHRQVAAATRHPAPGGHLLCTPVGDFLMVPGPEVDEDDHAQAVRLARALHPSSRAAGE